MKNQLHRPVHNHNLRMLNNGQDYRQNHIYDIWRIITQPQTQVEAEIRALSSNAYVGNETSLCTMLGRYKIYVDTRDIGIANHLIMGGIWEYWVTQAMMRWIRPGTTVMDVGANMGYFTILMNDLVGENGKVHSFEPNPRMSSLIEKSLRTNGFYDRTILHKCGVGSRKSNVTLDIQGDMPGGASLRRKERGKSELTTDEIKVPVIRLDSIPEAHEASFFKIDVEGYEYEVWKGMSGIINTPKQLHIFMEFTVNRYDNAEAFLYEMLDAGFNLNLLEHSGRIRPISPVDVMIMPHNIDHMLFLAR